MAAYARLAKDSEMISWATEIKVRAERKAGEMLAEAKKNGERANRGKPAKMSNDATLSDIGISRDQSSRWQKLAGISEQQNRMGNGETQGDNQKAESLEAIPKLKDLDVIREQ